MLALAFACSSFENDAPAEPPGDDGGTQDAITGVTDESFQIDELKKVSVVQGQSVKVTLSVNRTQPLKQKQLAIQLKLVDPPAGISIDPAKVLPDRANVEVTLKAAADAKQGAVTLRFEGTVEGTSTRATREVPAIVRGPTGALDTTFATEGFQTAVFGVGPNALVHRAFVLSDGKILVAAETTNAAGYGLARLDANGKLDTTYGDGGRFYLSEFHNGAVAFAPDGTVFLLGVDENTVATTLCRVTPAGKRDTTLNASGCVAVDVAGGWMAVAPDGNIVVAGQDPGGGIQLAKLTSSGQLIASFGTQGKTTVKHGTSSEYVERLVVRPDGRVLATDRTGDTTGAVFQLTAAGAVDPSFAVPKINFLQYGAPLDLFLQNDGRFVVTRGQNNNTILGGYKENGEPDPTFVGTGFPGVDGHVLAHSLVRTESGQIAFVTCPLAGPKLFRVDDKGIPDPALPAAGLPLAIDPAPDAGIDPVKPCGPLVPAPEDRFVIAWTRKVGTPDKFDVYVARIWN